jgi:hypothetical protein
MREFGGVPDNLIFSTYYLFSNSIFKSLIIDLYSLLNNNNLQSLYIRELIPSFFYFLLILISIFQITFGEIASLSIQIGTLVHSFISTLKITLFH